MATYFIASPHSKEECMRALDETLDQGTKVLEKYEYGCKAGDHTAYAFVEAPSDNVARDHIPGFLRPKARVVQVNRFTPDQIKSMHSK